MADYLIMKAVEFDKLPAAFKKKHGNVQALVDAGYWVQHKYDGCMGIAEVWPEGLGVSRMLSRTGEDYSKSCGHILRVLEAQVTGPRVFIGEVWQPIEEATFHESSGKFRRQRPSPELRFVVNDVLPLGFNTARPYYMRYANLRGKFPVYTKLTKETVTVAFTLEELGKVEYTIDAFALDAQGRGGYDGAIVRNPDAGYTVGMVKNGEIIKVKPTLSLDLRVVTTNQTFGEKTGRSVYTHVVEYRGVHSEVGSGVPHDIRNVAMAGQIVEIECLGLTPDGKLREPRFKSTRFDKLEPDT